MKQRPLLLLALAACVPDTKIDPRTRISCSETERCPDGFECIVDECAPVNGNQPPSITIGAIQPSATTVRIPITVYDPESDTVTLSVELGRNGELTALPFDDAFESSPDGVVSELEWDAQSFFAASARLANLTVRVTPKDTWRYGPSVVSMPFAFGNNPPRVTALTVGSGGVVRGTVPIGFLVIDDDDLVSVTKAVLHQGATEIPLDLQKAASFPGTSLTGLPATEAGAQATLAWDSSLTLAQAGADTTLELEVTDSLGATSAIAVSPKFVMSNAPSIALALATTRGLDGIGVNYTADAATGRSVSVAFSYRIGGGAWAPAGTATGASGTFQWDGRLASGFTLTPRDRDGDGATNDDPSVIDYADDVELSAVATDDTMLSGVPAVTPMFALGDTPPTIALETIAGTQRNEVPIAFSLTDAESDPASVELEFCLSGDPCTPSAAPASAGWRKVKLGHGSLTALASGAAVPHVVTWASLSPRDDATPSAEQGIGDRLESDVKLRGRAASTFSGGSSGGNTVYGDWSAVLVVTQVRNQSPPRIENLRVRRLGSQGGVSPVAIDYTVLDEEADVVDIECRFSQDGGPFQACAEYADPRSEGRYDLASAPPALGGGGGVRHTFMWDPSGQMAPASATRVQLLPHDSRAFGLAEEYPAAAATIYYNGDMYYNALDPPTQYGYGPGSGGPSDTAVLANFVTDDFNRDGLPDIAGAYDASPTLRLYFGIGSDGLVGAARELGNTGPNRNDSSLLHPPVQMAKGDVNGDGAPDLVIASAQHLTYLQNDGAGIFANAAPGIERTTAATQVSLVVGDFDGDAFADAAVAQSSPNAIVVSSGGPSGLTGLVSYALPAAPRQIVAGDFNRDGLVDLAVLDVLESISILPGAGSGAFDASALDTFAASGTRIDAADADNDGASDLVTCGSTGVVYRHNRGDGTFTTATVTADPTGSVRFSDYSGDGAPDLFVAKAPPALVTIPDPVPLNLYPLARIFVNDGGGGFAQNIPLREWSNEARTHMVDAIAVDFGGDRGPDLFYSTFRIKGGAQGYALINRMVGGYRSHFKAANQPVFDAPGFDANRFKKSKDFGAGGAVAFASVPLDLDRDGRLDLVTLRGDGFPAVTPKSLGLWHASGNAGTSGEPLLSVLGSYTLPNYGKSLASGDFDGDGKGDVIVVGPLGTSVLFGTGATTLTNGPSLVSNDPYYPSAVTVADFNHDGYDDVAVAKVTSSMLSVWTSNGDRTFTTKPDVGTGLHSTTYAGGTFMDYEPRGVATCDVNSDGEPDLVVTNHYDIPRRNGSLSIRLGDGTGVFGPTAGTGPNSEIVITPETYDYFYPNDVVCADFDRDGIADLAAVGMADYQAYSAYPWPQYGVVLFGQGTNGIGDGTFGQQQPLPSMPSGPSDEVMYQITAGDLDADGVLDLVAAGGRGHVLAWRGTGLRATPFPANVGQQNVADLTSAAGRANVTLTDLDDDQLLDVVVTTTDRPIYGTNDLVTAFAPRFDSREPWRHTLKNPPPALRPPATLDRAGRPIQGPVLSMHRAAKGPKGEADPTGSLRRTKAQEMAMLVPVTDMWRATGDVHWKRDASGRLAVTRRWGPATELPIDLPLYGTMASSYLASGMIKVFHAKVEWRRADEEPTDALFGMGPSAHAFLPRVNDNDIVLENVTWSQVPAGKVSIVTNPTDGHVVRLLTSELGWFQAFIDPP